MSLLATTALTDIPPPWSLRLLGRSPSARDSGGDGISVRALQGRHFSLASVRVPEAVRMDASVLRNRTTDAYRRIQAILAGRPERHLVRMWNFIPDILAPLEPFPHRYMAFNAGRFAAFDDWFRGAEELKNCVPTSTGVGHNGSDLVVHALSCDQPGVAVENTRQIPSYLYSRRYGPRPPCFSRATRLKRDGPRLTMLLVGGTASVVGEDTAHAANLPAQMDETLENLAALVRTGLPEEEGVPLPGDLLDVFRFLRVYYARQEDEDPIARMVRARFTGLHEVEYVEATLCRPGLIVEIEGVASATALPELAAVH